MNDEATPPAEQATFKPIGESDEPTFGPRKLLLLGFTAEEQRRVRTLMAEDAGLPDVPLVFVRVEDRTRTLEELFALDRGPGEEVTEQAPKVFIMAGVTHRELHTIMETYKRTDLPRPIWAGLTPTSVTWTLRQLVSDLVAEHAAMAARRRRRPSENGDP